MKPRQILLIGLGVLVIVLVLAMLFSESRAKYDWDVSYKAASKEPYGTHILYNLLDDAFPGASRKTITTSIAEELPLDVKTPANFFFIGGNMYMDSSDTRQLLDFVSEGNTAFISSEAIPYDLVFELYFDECDNYPWAGYAELQDSVVVPNLWHPEVTLEEAPIRMVRKFKPRQYGWSYIEEDYFCDQEYGFTGLGDINEEYINFARVKYGSGYFYLHTTPLSLTNFQLVQPAQQAYATALLAHLHPGTIYWDEYSRVPAWFDPSRHNRQRSSINRKGPLQYVLAQPPLAWAWWTLVGMGLFYLIFRARRRQDVVPVVEKNENTSLQFLQTVSQLSFVKNNHRLLAERLIRQWHSFVRERFRIDYRELEEEVFVQQLATASKVAQSDIEKILSLHLNYQRAEQISDRQLIDFYQRLEAFYHQTRS